MEITQKPHIRVLVPCIDGLHGTRYGLRIVDQDVIVHVREEHRHISVADHVHVQHGGRGEGRRAHVRSLDDDLWRKKFILSEFKGFESLRSMLTSAIFRQRQHRHMHRAANDTTSNC